MRQSSYATSRPYLWNLRKAAVLLAAGCSLCLAQTPPATATLPPIVHVEMPKSDPVTHLIEVFLPGLIGAAIALSGVWLTNRTSEKTNALARQHQLDLERIKDEIAAEGRSRDNRWEFRKQVYCDVVQVLSEMLILLRRTVAVEDNLRSAMENAKKGVVQDVGPLHEKVQAYTKQVDFALAKFYTIMNQCSLATADWLQNLVTEMDPSFNDLDGVLRSDTRNVMRDRIERVNAMLKAVVERGRKDLWNA